MDSIELTAFQLGLFLMGMSIYMSEQEERGSQGQDLRRELGDNYNRVQNFAMEMGDKYGDDVTFVISVKQRKVSTC